MWDFSIISLIPTSFIVGASYYAPKPNYNYHEANLYLFIIQLQLRWNE